MCAISVLLHVFGNANVNFINYTFKNELQYSKSMKNKYL